MTDKTLTERLKAAIGLTGEVTASIPVTPDPPDGFVRVPGYERFDGNLTPSDDVPTPALSAADTLGAAESIDSLARLFRNMTRASEVLRSIGTAANTAAELESRIVGLRADAAALAEKVVKARQDQAAAEADARAAAEGARTVAAGIEAESKAFETATIQASKERAAAIIADAQRTAADRLAEASKVLGDVGQKVTEKSKEIEALEAERLAKLDALATIQSKIDAARAAAATILGNPS